MARAIAKYEQADSYLANVNAAIKRRDDSILALYRALEDAEAAISEARKKEPGRLVAALADNVPADAASPLEAAEKAVTTVKAEMAKARAEANGLQAERARAESAVSIARTNRTGAIQEVVKSDGFARRLLARMHKLYAEAASLLNALDLVAFDAPKDFNGRAKLEPTVELKDVDLSLRNALQQTLVALETDVDAQFPPFPV